ncbi:MAG: hypothetical protein WA734_00120 [Candidatus Acidiferrales bacterium]
MNRKVSLALAGVVLMLLGACASGTHSGSGGGGGGTPPPSLSIAITTAPASTVEINNSTTVAATVMNDSTNAGVDWTCSPSPCGSFSPTHTASGATTTWSAPSSGGTYTLTAASTATPSTTATASVTVNTVASNSNLSGQYAFYLSGFDFSGDAYAAAGSVTLDGNGNVTSGEEDLNSTDVDFTSAIEGDTLAGTYTVNGDGQGTMTLNASNINGSDPLVGNNGVQTLSFVVVNSNHILIAEFDSVYTSSGSMDLQTASAFSTGVSGNFAVSANGFIGGAPAVFGGVYTASAGTITGTGTADEDLNGTSTIGGNLSGTVSAADANGRGTFTLTTPSGSGTFTYYLVGPEALYLTEVDTGAVMVGQSYGQGSGTFSNSSLASANVLDETESFTAVGAANMAGQFTTSSSALSGVVDYNVNGLVDGVLPAPSITQPPTPSTLTGTYTIASTGYGSASVTVSGTTDFATYGIYATDPALNVNDPNNTTGGGGALIVELDSGTLGTGFVVPQTATAISTVNEADSFSAIVEITSADEFLNSTGQYVYSNGSFSGTANVNDFNLAAVPPAITENAAVTISGVITADSTNVGRYSEVVTLPVIGGGSATNYRVTYVANGGFAVGVDTDTNEPGLTEIGSDLIEGQQ